VGNYDPLPALEKAFRISVDMGGFSSLVVSQIPSLKFSPFPLALGLYPIKMKNWKTITNSKILS
jgi:hypothetical protein